ncbi:MAG: DUF885 family protein [Acidobacteria bacterium]|nr:DUF885 family protein [Acidobacteriota bacterium]
MNARSMSRRWLAASAMVALVAAASACSGPSAPPAEPAVERSTSYDDLLALFKEFRAMALPEVRDGVPDYTTAAMEAQHAKLRTLQRRLDGIDSSGWPVAQRVDHLLVIAEFRGLDFHHRVIKPWRRDPAYYSTTSLGFGPKIHDALQIPRLPVPADRLDAFAVKLRGVPAVLEQAKGNLTEMAADLARLAIRQKAVEQNVYTRLAEDLAGHHPELVDDAKRAAEAAADFSRWLEEQLPRMTAPAGIGRENYDWYMRHVLLFPYTWEDMRIIGEREYERALVWLKIEEHKNRGVPMIAPAESFEEFERRRYEADVEMLAWLRAQQIFTVPDYLVPPRGEGPYVLPSDRDPKKPGPFDPPIRRHFFREAEDRDPRPLRAHNLPGHLLDSQMRRRDDRPIRGQSRLFFIDGTRAEGWSYYLEEFIQQAGLLDNRPKTKEINYILQAKRAARVLPELKMHSNEWTFDQALESLTSRTPYWMAPDDAIAFFDMELYLRQPGYGIGYYIGKVQMEELFARRAQQLGAKFNLTEFHDQFLAAGVMPISLIRWEMTGLDDQVRTMW